MAKRRLCLGPAGVINCTSLSALSFSVSLFPEKRGYNMERGWQAVRQVRIPTYERMGLEAPPTERLL